MSTNVFSTIWLMIWPAEEDRQLRQLRQLRERMQLGKQRQLIELKEADLSVSHSGTQYLSLPLSVRFLLLFLALSGEPLEPVVV